jgi:transcriptional regulator with XRE-family HTH domain
VNVELVRKKREDKGIARDVLARMIGVAPSTLARSERGERELREGELVKLAEVLGLTLEEVAGTPAKEVAK